MRWFPLLAASVACAGQGIITTFAGTSITYPSGSFSAFGASYGLLGGVAVNPLTGEIYFTSQTRSLIVKLNPASNLTTVVAGIAVAGYSGDGGPATSAALNGPHQIVFDSSGNLYIADLLNSAIRRIDPTGVITTYARTPNQPWSIAIAADGTLYAATQAQILHINTNGAITVVGGSSNQQGYAGDGGPAVNALFNTPQGLTFDASGNLLIADTYNNRIRRIDKSGVVTTIAGNGQDGAAVNGTATLTPVQNPVGIAVDAQGNLYVGDTQRQLLKISAAGALTILNSNPTTYFLGTSGGPVSNAIFNPQWPAFDGAGNLYFVDLDAGYLWELTNTGTVRVAAAYSPGFGIGDGKPAAFAGLNFPNGIWVQADGSLLIADEFDLRVRRILPSGTITTVAGSGLPGATTSGTATSASLDDPSQVAADSVGNIYIALGTNIVRVNSSGALTPFYTTSSVNAIAVDAQGNLLVATTGNVIQRITPSGTATTIAGTGAADYTGDNGPAVSATLNGPQGVAADAAGNIYIADSYNNVVRKISSKGIITTIGGQGSSEINGVPATQSAIYFPTALACDGPGNLYIGEAYGNVVRMISTSGIISAVAGTGTAGYTGDGGPATSATLNQPRGIAVDGAGNIYIADGLNNRIREIPTAAPSISASPVQVTLAAASFGAAVESAIAVTSSAQGLGYTISSTVASGGNWLSTSLSQSQAPSVFLIVADPSNLAPGNYQGTVTITSPLATPPILSIKVTFNVASTVAPSLAVSPSPLSFSAIAGSAGAATGQLTVSNQGGGTLMFTASSVTATGGSFLQISPASGTASAGAPGSLTVTATPGSLPVGTYTGSIAISSTTTSQSVTVPVTLTINPAPQTILLSQAGLTFTGISQGGSVIPQVVGILNVGSGSMTFSASAATTSGGSWLSVSPTTATVVRPYLDVSYLQVNVNAQSLAAGKYFGSVQISSPGASNSPQTVLVVLDVEPPGTALGPQQSVTGLVFTGVTGGENPGAQTVTIANPTSTSVTFGDGMSYATAKDWITYLPQNATIDPTTPQVVTVQPNLGSLGQGFYRSALTLTFDDAIGSILTVGILAVLAPPGTAPSARAPGAKAGGGCTATQLLPLFTDVPTGGYAVTVGYPAALVVDVVDDCGVPMTAGSVIVSFNNNDPPLPMQNLSNGQWAATWVPQHALGGVTLSVTAQESGLMGSRQANVGVQGTQTLPVASGGVVNAVTLTQGPIAPGEIVLIRGSGLADAEAKATTTPLSQQLAGAQVAIGSDFASLLYADSSQLIAQVPTTVPVNATTGLAVARDTTPGVPTSIAVAGAQPAVFSSDGSGSGQALVYLANGSGAASTLVSSSNPAAPGAAVMIYCAGLGMVDGNGNATNPVSVLIGGQAAQISYAGLAIATNYPAGGPPQILGLVPASLGGLYQINAVVPTGVGSGPASVVVSVAGQSSPFGTTLAVAGGSTGGGPVPVPVGVVNAASFAKNATGAGSAVAPGSLIQVYSSLQGASAASAAGAYPTALGGVGVTFDGISAPLQSVTPSGEYPFINVQVPFEITNSSTSMVVTVNGVSSAPFMVPVATQAPGVFTIPPGVGNAVLVNLSDYSIAAPTGSIPGLNAHPIARGQTAFFYATGLGAMTPGVADGSANCSSATGCTANATPTVLVGGVPAQLVFAGQAGVYPGVNQINITIPANAPVGSAVPLQVMSADGRVLSTTAATIAIQ